MQTCFWFDFICIPRCRIRTIASCVGVKTCDYLQGKVHDVVLYVLIFKQMVQTCLFCFLSRVEDMDFIIHVGNV